MGGLACAIKSATSEAPGIMKKYYEDMTIGLREKLDDLMGLNIDVDEDTADFFISQGAEVRRWED